ncbi:hypothetical protein LX36DRAFT_569419 [Colletotrichum falcatum]|nr:hypothetical protein LX36DRAFT_569419 [Colletotrichum falcatum]
MGAYVESSIQATGEALIWLNSLTGHWGTTIVFAAFAVAVVRTPLQMITKQILNKQIEAMPLVNAWALQLPRSDRLSEALQLARTRKRLFKERGCQNWKAWAPALGIPIWLLMSETLRRLCGARGGWLSLLSGDYKDPAQPTADAAASLSEQMSPPLSPSLQTISDGLQSLGSTVEAGMANSGWLWFTDLTVADPTMALPGILMLTMGYAMWPRQKEMRNIVFDLGNSKLYMTPGLKWRVRLQRGLLVSAVLVPAVCCNLPAGLFLYWIASMTFSQVSGRVVDVVLPKPRAVQPCQRRERVVLPIA